MTDPSRGNNNNANVTISQEYFDEVCLENRDDFELDEDEAVQETIQQLSSSLGGGDNKLLASHLSLTFPTSEQGIKERKVNTCIQSCIAHVQAAVLGDDDAPAPLSETLQTLWDCIRQDEAQRVPRFVLFGGFDTCLKLWQNTDMAQQCDNMALVYPLLLTTFALERESRGKNTNKNVGVLQLQDLQKGFLRQWPAWIDTLEKETSADVEEWNLKRLHQILEIANFAVKQSEPNKKAFMASKASNSLKSPTLLLLSTLDSLSLSNGGTEQHHQLVGTSLCSLIAAVCTFDDFGTTQQGAAPTVASAHANVQAFAQENGVVRIARYFQEKHAICAILALRAMAIHDEIVQAMVAVRVLDTAASLLQRLLDEKPDNDKPSSSKDDDDGELSLEALTAVVGLFRNVCANDEIKSKLCVGEKSVVLNVIHAMNAYPDAFKLQEHACAMFAAMALRSPRNAEYLVQKNDAATWIVRAMQKHPSRNTVQRQGALALRNLVSRSTELRATVLQAGAAEALKDIAAKHVSCQDEVYAALRDLGLPASMLRVEQNANGQLVIKETEMFGERKSNFRPVFD